MVLERAKLSIKAAKEAGADAIKIQTYNADTMTIDCEKGFYNSRWVMGWL